nr:936_t:CDS:2 [Entrophospora candida]CAG8549774.1 6668_t:CDS:2 [Entrophospora candida]
MPLPLLFIPKNRKANFDIEITIEELLNVPSIAGLYYVKWKFKHRGELNGGKEISNIGRLKINLSEYVGSTIITRHFLLRESKVNSTLKNLFYFRPPLKKTQIFNGIAGMISDHNEHQDDERSIGLNTAHYIAKSKSTSSLRSAYYAQANHTTPITSSLAANNFLLNIDSKSPIDVIEEIFMGNDPNNDVDVND